MLELRHNVTLGQAEMTVPLKIGRAVTFRAGLRTFTVRRLRKACWHLCDIGIRSRSRFGTLAEIREDVASVLETGALPGGDKGRW